MHAPRARRRTGNRLVHRRQVLDFPLRRLGFPRGEPLRLAWLGGAGLPGDALPGTGQATPSTAADTLARHLTGQGITGTYIAACDRYALISVTTGLRCGPTAASCGGMIPASRDPGPPPTLHPPHAARRPRPARCRLNPGGDRQSEQS